MKKWQIERIQNVLVPAVVGVTVTVASIVSLVQIRREDARRRRWEVPIVIIGALLLAGITGALVEYAVNSQPVMQCRNGSYLTSDGTRMCRASSSF